jgi:hypothetical protein
MVMFSSFEELAISRKLGDKIPWNGSDTQPSFLVSMDSMIIFPKAKICDFFQAWNKI